MSTASVPQNADFSLYLHAELLPNIRQITLYVSLPQIPALERTRPEIQLSESCKSVTVSLPEPFDYVAKTIKLPARVTDATRQTLNIDKASSSPGKLTSSGYDFSVRMHIDPSDPVLAPRDELIDDYVPWTAADMSSSTRIRCRGCGTPFLKDPGPDHVAEESGRSLLSSWLWKDLPSGNWAEMMDFWHCHKPDPHEDNPKSEAVAALKLEDKNAQIKGYGASSRVEAIPGTVLLDVGTFLLSEGDCINLKKVSFPHVSDALRSLETPSTLFPYSIFFRFPPMWATRRRPFLGHVVASDTIALDQRMCMLAHRLVC